VIVTAPMEGAAERVVGAIRSILGNRMVWIWAGVWVVTRALIVANVGFWDDSRPDYWLEDVNRYREWSEILATEHAIPDEDSWQYPPGAAWLMLIPRLGPGSYGDAFVGLMLIIDLIGLCLLALLGRRSGNYTGVWVWLLAMPLLRVYPVLRFDIVPAVIGIAALVLIHRRPTWFGALAGLGASIKVWPIVVLFGEWNRRRLLVSVLAAITTATFVLLVSAIAFGDLSTFLDEQSGRGLQEEAVATAPWQLRELITGQEAHRALRYGAWEIPTHSADVVADILKWLSLAVLAAAAVWWWLRARAIRTGRADLTDAAVSRDFVFTIVLLLVVTSRVLSPQFMLWMLGLAAVVLTAGTTRLARPAWVVIGAIILSTAAFESAEHTLFRNLGLLAATIDASIAMILMLRRPEWTGPADTGPSPPAAERVASRSRA
jgi:Glycosyltransferase family 87